MGTSTAVEAAAVEAAAVGGAAVEDTASALLEYSSTRVIMMDHCLTKAAVAYGDGPVSLKVKSALVEIPSVMLIDNLKDAKVALEGIFPAWSEQDITRVASVVYKAQGARINASSTTFEKGLCAMGSPCDASLPVAIDSAKAEVIWSRYEWNELK